MATAKQVIEKTAAEVKQYTFDFADYLQEGETIDSITSTSRTPTSLTIGSAGIGEDNVSTYLTVSGGTADTLYKIFFNCHTTAGNTIVGVGYLVVTGE